MGDKFVGIACIVLGIYLMVNHKNIGQTSADRSRKIIPFSKPNAKEYAVGFLIGGIVFALFGVLVLLGVIHFNG